MASEGTKWGTELLFSVFGDRLWLAVALVAGAVTIRGETRILALRPLACGLLSFDLLPVLGFSIGFTETSNRSATSRSSGGEDIGDLVERQSVRSASRINSWDLVDATAPRIVRKQPRETGSPRTATTGAIAAAVGSAHCPDGYAARLGEFDDALVFSGRCPLNSLSATAWEEHSAATPRGEGRPPSAHSARNRESFGAPLQA